MRKPCYYIFLFSLSLMLFAFRSEGQQLKLGNNPTFIQPSAVLQLDSKNQGLLLTRVPDTSVTSGIDAFTPPDGMIIYFTDSSAIGPYGPNAGVYERKNGKWQRMLFAGDGSYWSLTGNSGTNPATNFLGTTDNNSLIFKVNNNQVANFGTNNGISLGNGVTATNPNTIILGTNAYAVGIGTNTPAFTFDVNGSGRFVNALTLNQDLIVSNGSGTNNYILRSLGAGTSPMWESLALDSLSNVNISNPQNGDILLYSNTSNKWANTSGNGTFWSLNGNSGTNSTTNFLGTTDQQPLVFKANGNQVGYLGYGGGSGGDNNVIFGNGSSISAGSTYAIAIGNANAGATYAVAIGDGAQATGNPSTSVGYFNSATGNSSLALGNNSTSAGSSSVALGSSASTVSTASNGIAIGTNANSGNNAAVAIGNNAIASGSISTAIGYGSSATANSAFALGYSSTASGSYSSALSSIATASGSQSTALGYQSKASASNATAIGENAYAWNPNTLILGDTINNINVGIGTNNPQYNLEVFGTGKFDNTLYLGADLNTSGSSGTSGQVLTSNGAGVMPSWQTPTGGAGSYWSLGGNNISNSNFLGSLNNYPLVFEVNNSQAGYLGTSSNYNTSFGLNSSVLSQYTTAIGGNASASNQYATALGYNSSAGGQYATAIGYNSTAGGQYAIVLGNMASASSQYSMALGYNANSSGQNSVVIGPGALSNSYQGISIGYNAQTNGNQNNTIALGSNVSATGYQGIAIGTNATASSNNNTLAIGVGATASGYQSTSMGNGAQATQPNSTAIGNGATANYSNALILGNNSVLVGIRQPNPQYALDVNAQIRVQGTVYTSDIRYKKNLQELRHVLSAIDSLHGYTYYFRTKEFKDKDFPNTKQIGMIAQEVEKYFPELVSTDKNGYKSLNYAQFTAVLLEAVKEQQTEINELKKENEQNKKTIQDQLNALQKKVDTLEKMVEKK